MSKQDNPISNDTGSPSTDKKINKVTIDSLERSASPKTKKTKNSDSKLQNGNHNTVANGAKNFDSLNGSPVGAVKVSDIIGKSHIANPPSFGGIGRLTCALIGINII